MEYPDSGYSPNILFETIFLSCPNFGQVRRINFVREPREPRARRAYQTYQTDLTVDCVAAFFFLDTVDTVLSQNSDNDRS